MSKALNTIINWFRNIKNSIAFYPTLIAIGMTIIAISAIAWESSYITQKIADKLPVLIISDPGTARSILNTMIGGIISLMVFSFSMVMVLLSQASSNYSPRLLPGLITNKRHQIVLGIYLGTILFCILCSINVLPKEGSYSIPSLTILLSISLGVICLGMFVYFIHSISESIQISNILKKLFLQGKKNIEFLASKSVLVANTEALHHEIRSNKNGYLTFTSTASLIETAKEGQLKIEISKAIGTFVLDGEVVLRTSKPIDKNTKNKLLNCLHFDVSGSIEASYFAAIKNITEVALKAMSPGINDPGTALLALNYLILLIAQRMKIGNETILSEASESYIVSQKQIPFKELIFSIFAELRTYTTHDQSIIRRVLSGFDYLIQQPSHLDDYYQILNQEKSVFISHSKQELTSPCDKEIVS